MCNKQDNFVRTFNLARINLITFYTSKNEVPFFNHMNKTINKLKINTLTPTLKQLR